MRDGDPESAVEASLAPAEALLAGWLEAQRAGQAAPFEDLCRQHPQLAAELRRIHAQFRRMAVLASEDFLSDLRREPASSAELTGAREVAPSRFSTVLETLARRRAGESRYELGEEFAQGGMGAIRRAHDVDLRRDVARKSMLAPLTKSETSLGRFLDEAQVTAQLEHPGVVAVHELGLDEAGQLFFTMSLVSGRDLDAVYADVRSGDPDWTVTRVVDVLMRVSETMAYAHSKGVLHRDLKPSNVMVGEFGQVYVMDWGLAKVLGSPEPGSEELAAESASGTRSGSRPTISTARRDLSDSDPDSALLTREGHAAGTLRFMSPEQLRGENKALDARTDVYALGAMLYSLLAGHHPYADISDSKQQAVLVEAILEGPPTPLLERNAGAPLELVAIAEKAMARAAQARYEDMHALAKDLRAYLEGRVVGAYEQGPWAELRKWIARNRGLSIAVAGLLLAVVLGSTGMFLTEARRRAAVELKQQQTQLSLDRRVSEALVPEQQELWPSVPAMAPGLGAWLERARTITALAPAYHEEALSLRANSPADAEAQKNPTALSADEEVQSRELEALLDSASALPEWITAVEARYELASTLRTRTLDGPEAKRLWAEAATDIESLEVYGQLHLNAQLGLLPLRRDPGSGLWEFWHVASGSRPELDSKTGRWAITPATGIVLVLLPGGPTTVGAIPETAENRGEAFTAVRFEFNPESEWGLHELTLDPFFMAKHELTQAQFQRVIPDLLPTYPYLTTAHPMESISWVDAMEAARRLALALPTEAQWEYACRAGTTTQFFTGQDPESLEGFANAGYLGLADGSERRISDWTESDTHSPVGFHKPNAFGLHDVHGNVWEWCLDPFHAFGVPREGDGLRLHPEQAYARVMRGGNYNGDPRQTRASMRYEWGENNQEWDTGVRLARPLDPRP